MMKIAIWWCAALAGVNWYPHWNLHPFWTHWNWKQRTNYYERRMSDDSFKHTASIFWLNLYDQQQFRRTKLEGFFFFFFAFSFLCLFNFVTNIPVELIFCIWQTSAGAVILTDIVFWCVIVPFLSISHFKLNMVSAILL